LKGADISFHRFFVVVGRDTDGGELVWGGIFAGRILNVFPCSTRTKSPMDKRGPQLDLTDRIGLEPVLTEFLIVG